VPVTTLELVDFRCFTGIRFEPDPTGLTVLRGANGAGKTSVLEAVGWLATQRSFRGAPREALVRTGQERAFVRAEIDQAGRRVQIEAEVPGAGPARTLVNRQVVRRRSQLADGLRVTVFAPDDLQLIQGGPMGRRDLLDEILVTGAARHDALVADVDRCLRQRAALLRQAGGRLGPDEEATLAVWDERLAAAGTGLAEARAALVAALEPLVDAATRRLAGDDTPVHLVYRRSWTGDLAEALAATRRDDLRRQTTGLGPHRDDVDIVIGTRPSRTHASQGEQRSVALALRLAAHRLAAETHVEPPVLLLDDVFSELDATRAEALVGQLPPGQVLLTTAADPPAVITPNRVVVVAHGQLVGDGAGR